jgi:hypothetical protein
MEDSFLLKSLSLLRDSIGIYSTKQNTKYRTNKTQNIEQTKQPNTNKPKHTKKYKTNKQTNTKNIIENLQTNIGWSILSHCQETYVSKLLHSGFFDKILTETDKMGFTVFHNGVILGRIVALRSILERVQVLKRNQSVM